jgi:hypothetical protein
MSATDTSANRPKQLSQPTEQEIVEDWRAQELKRAGYPVDFANELAMRPDVDLHYAVELVAYRGCAPDLAAQILL